MTRGVRAELNNTADRSTVSLVHTFLFRLVSNFANILGKSQLFFRIFFKWPLDQIFRNLLPCSAPIHSYFHNGKRCLSWLEPTAPRVPINNEGGRCSSLRRREGLVRLSAMSLPCLIKILVFTGCCISSKARLMSDYVYQTLW